MRIKITTTASTLALLLPIRAFAVRGGELPGVSSIDTAPEVIKAMTAITNWIFSGFLMVAVVMVLLAAFDFLTAQGDAEKFGQAKKSILYAAIAVAIAVLAKSIVMIAAGIVGGSVSY